MPGQGLEHADLDMLKEVKKKVAMAKKRKIEERSRSSIEWKYQ